MEAWGFHRRRSRPGRRVARLAAIACVAAAAACAGQGSAEEVDSPLAIEVSQLFMTIENTAGLPLTDVTIAIVPAGAMTEFTRFFSRIESAERRNISLGDFQGRDGTPFNLRVARPRAIRVEGKDLTGKEYAAELPWQLR